MGLLIIISSPTGGGKDAVIARLLKKFSRSVRLVTTTSRPPRPTDKEGVTYHFVSPDEFKKRIKEGRFLEYNNMAGNYYGTPKQDLADLLQKYDLVFSNLDVNGKSSMDKAGVKNLSIFLLPESMEILKKRAEKRGGMSAEMIAARIKIAEEEIARSKDYDCQITNYEGKLPQTAAAVAEIIKKYLKNNPPIDKTRNNS